MDTASDRASNVNCPSTGTIGIGTCLGARHFPEHVSSGFLSSAPLPVFLSPLLLLVVTFGGPVKPIWVLVGFLAAFRLPPGMLSAVLFLYCFLS